MATAVDSPPRAAADEGTPQGKQPEAASPAHVPAAAEGGAERADAAAPSSERGDGSTGAVPDAKVAADKVAPVPNGHSADAAAENAPISPSKSKEKLEGDAAVAAATTPAIPQHALIDAHGRPYFTPKSAFLVAPELYVQTRRQCAHKVVRRPFAALHSHATAAGGQAHAV